MNSRAGAGVKLKMEINIGESKQSVTNGENDACVPLQVLVVQSCIYSYGLGEGDLWFLFIAVPGRPGSLSL